MLRNRAERNLFFTLWGMILFGTAVWFLLPKEHPLPDRPPPTVQLGPELSPILTARLAHWEETRFELQYAPTAEYRNKLSGEGKDLQVQYELRNESRTIASGMTTLHLSEGDATVKLANEDRRVPTVIFLSLPR